MENNENVIKVSKYVYFDKESGNFFLTSEAQNIIYREKNIICSYSGSNEWCNHFICEMLDLYSGASRYNYALGTTVHETEIPKIFKVNKESVIRWIDRIRDEEWGFKMFKMFDNIIDDLPIN